MRSMGVMEIKTELRAEGIPEDIINYAWIAQDKTSMGYGKTDDDFMMLARNAYPSNPTEAKAYKDNPPIMVFRVNPNKASSNFYSLKTPERTKQGWSEDYLESLQKALAYSVMRKHGLRNVEETSKSIKAEPFEGPKCIRIVGKTTTPWNKPATTIVSICQKKILKENP